MSEDSRLISSAVDGAKALGSLTARELRMAALLALGTWLAKNADSIASWVSMPELSPVVFKAALVALGLGFSRLLMRLYFKWLDLSDLVEKAKETPLSAAIVASAFVYMLATMFNFVVVT